MTLSDIYDRTTQIDSVEHLESLLSARYDDRQGKKVNNFVLELHPEKFPWMSTHVIGEWAYIGFVKDKENAGYHSIGNLEKFRSIELVDIHGPGGLDDTVWVPGYAMINFADAVAAAKEFFVSGELPKCIEWFEL